MSICIGIDIGMLRRYIYICREFALCKSPGKTGKIFVGHLTRHLTHVSNNPLSQATSGFRAYPYTYITHYKRVSGILHPGTAMPITLQPYKQPHSCQQRATQPYTTPKTPMPTTLQAHVIYFKISSKYRMFNYACHDTLNMFKGYKIRGMNHGMVAWSN